jgi:hypothetical protein
MTLKPPLAQSGPPPPVDLHIFHGRGLAQKLANMLHNLEHERIAPTEIVCGAKSLLSREGRPREAISGLVAHRRDG